MSGYTPPPTSKRVQKNMVNPSTPSSPSPVEKKMLSSNEEKIDWREWPLTLFSDSRQLRSDEDAPNSGSPGRSTISPKVCKERLFLAHSPSTSSIEPDEGDATSEEDEVVFVGSASCNVTVANDKNDSHSDIIYHHIPHPRQAQASLRPHQTDQSLGVHSSKRYREEDVNMEEEEDIAFVGRSYKYPRTEQRDVATSSSREDTPLRSLAGQGKSTDRDCRCACSREELQTASRGKGTGSNVLSAKIRGNIAALLLNQEQSLYVQLRSHPKVRDWKDIAEMVGARREDFDRVRHSARWLQENLPNLVARGLL